MQNEPTTRRPLPVSILKPRTRPTVPWNPATSPRSCINASAGASAAALHARTCLSPPCSPCALVDDPCALASCTLPSHHQCCCGCLARVVARPVHDGGRPSRKAAENADVDSEGEDSPPAAPRVKPKPNPLRETHRKVAITMAQPKTVVSDLNKAGAEHFMLYMTTGLSNKIERERLSRGHYRNWEDLHHRVMGLGNLKVFGTCLLVRSCRARSTWSGLTRGCFVRLLLHCVFVCGGVALLAARSDPAAQSSRLHPPRKSGLAAPCHGCKTSTTSRTRSEPGPERRAAWGKRILPVAERCDSR